MVNKRWWDLVVIGGGALLALIVVWGRGSAPAGETVGAVVSAVVFVGVYLVGARPLLGTSAPARYPAVIGALAITVGVGAMFTPLLASLQAFAYPLAWVLSGSRRQGIWGSVSIGVAVMLGYSVAGRFEADAIAVGVGVGGASIVFAVALGLWITSIAEYSDERARLVTELTAAQQQVEALGIERGAAAEGERLAREIHDTLAQTLAGLVLLSERAVRQIRDGDTDAAASTITTVEDASRDALGEARALVARTASVPSDLALEAAIDRLVTRFRIEAGVPVHWEADPANAGAAPPRASRESQVVVLRCIQEALSNVRKHAGATRVSVAVKTHGNEHLLLVVADDGRGFDMGHVRTGYGVDGMKERVKLAGGDFEVQSELGKGTTVTVRLPREVGMARSDLAAGGRTNVSPATIDTAPMEPEVTT